MLNTGEILQTIEMLDQQHLDIRTITMGINLLDCADADLDIIVCYVAFGHILYLTELLPLATNLKQPFAVNEEIPLGWA